MPDVDLRGDVLSEPFQSDEAPITMRRQRARMIAGAVIGNALEFYDFIIYGFFATEIAATFFPGRDPTTQASAHLRRLRDFVFCPAGGRPGPRRLCGPPWPHRLHGLGHHPDHPGLRGDGADAKPGVHRHRRPHRHFAGPAAPGFFARRRVWQLDRPDDRAFPECRGARRHLAGHQPEFRRAFHLRRSPGCWSPMTPDFFCIFRLSGSPLRSATLAGRSLCCCRRLQEAPAFLATQGCGIAARQRHAQRHHYAGQHGNNPLRHLACFRIAEPEMASDTTQAQIPALANLLSFSPQSSLHRPNIASARDRPYRWLGDQTRLRPDTLRQIKLFHPGRARPVSHGVPAERIATGPEVCAVHSF